MNLNLSLIEQLKSSIESQQAAFLRDLTELAAIDSGTYTPASVNQVVDWLAARAAALGWVAKRLPSKGYGDCLTVTVPGEGSARLLLIGHTDTVYPEGTAIARPVRIDGDILRGPGTSDMKAGVLAAIYALQSLQAAGFRDFARITLFCNSDEEVGSPASAPLYLPLAADADAALAFEAARANGDLVSARKGGGRYHIKVQGRSAHAGVEPEKGANAIVQLARLVDRAAALNGLHPGVTVSPGIVRGGEYSNIVPDYAECELDVRSSDVAGAQAVDSALHELAGRVTVPGTTVTVTGEFAALPMERTLGNAWLAEVATAIGQALGFPVKDGPMTGGRGDANYLAAAGIPVLDGLGPVGGQNHSPEEYLLVSSIVPRVALAAGLIVTACAHHTALQDLRRH